MSWFIVLWLQSTTAGRFSFLVASPAEAGSPQEPTNATATPNAIVVTPSTSRPSVDMQTPKGERATFIPSSSTILAHGGGADIPYLDSPR